MATTNNPGVWGIDIGQCALKALRCEVQEGELIATQVDYIEYPKILSQPDADPQALIAAALDQFIERNDIENEKVAVSVPGQSGLAKFFKPPPIELKKLRDIVEFEARQQIPFDLEEVVWDYQRMGGGLELEGLITEAEVGLFAMKRDQVIREMQPFEDADITLDAIQLAPMAVYNCITYDLLDNCPDPDVFDPDSPPPSYMVLAIGTETTDMIITNGFRVWHRSIPIGGNHFTRQMTQQLKLTFAKAEHLKRNARDAPDPKRVFQSMRSVYDNLGTEVQRSLRFFEGIDRKATIKEIVITGNTAKLPGLQAFIGKKLDINVLEMESFNRLKGSSVTASPTFKNNMLSFANCYGLCLQSLGIAQLQTNLLPREILFDRLVDSKKPWVVSAVALLLLAFSFNYFMQFGAYKLVAHDSTGTNQATAGPDSWETRIAAAQRVTDDSDDDEDEYNDRKDAYEALKKFGEQLVGNSDRQVMWIELLQTINAVLPKEQTEWRDPDVVTFSKRPDFYIESIDNAYLEDINEWKNKIATKHKAGITFIEKNRHIWLNGLLQPIGDAQTKEEQEAAEAKANFVQNNQTFVQKTADAQTKAEQEAAAAEANGANGNAAGALQGGGPVATNPVAVPVGGATDPGWVIQLTGYHYFNNDRETGYNSHVHLALLERLRQSDILLPTPDGPTRFNMEQMGITHIVLVSSKDEGQVTIGGTSTQTGVDEGGGADPAGGFGAGAGGDTTGGFGGTGGATEQPEETTYQATKFSFVVQFCWIPNEVTKRRDLKEAEDQAAADALAAEAARNQPVGGGNQEFGPPGNPGGAPANPPVPMPANN